MPRLSKPPSQLQLPCSLQRASTGDQTVTDSMDLELLDSQLVVSEMMSLANSFASISSGARARNAIPSNGVRPPVL